MHRLQWRNRRRPAGVRLFAGYAGSRQLYHLTQAGFLPRVFGGVNWRQAPATAVYLVGVIGLATAASTPNDAMVVFIFLISVAHVLITCRFQKGTDRAE